MEELIKQVNEQLKKNWEETTPRHSSIETPKFDFHPDMNQYIQLMMVKEVRALRRAVNCIEGAIDEKTVFEE